MTFQKKSLFSESDMAKVIQYKKKVCLLGGLESLKDEFQRKISSNCLSLEHKNNIGVSISTIDYSGNENYNFNYFLWNIDCGNKRSFIRTTFYTGAESIIVFISEDNVEQITSYLNEIKFRMPVITLIFCIFLKNHSIREIIDTYFITEEFQHILSNNDFKIKYINKPQKIFKQISSLFMKKVRKNEFQDNYIINFIPITALSRNSKTNLQCNDYFEPNRELMVINKRLNTKKIINYLKLLDIEVDQEYPDWVRIKNKEFGLFSIFLRNGSVYLSPKNCLNCKNKNCPKKKKMQHFICIEGETKGWSNVNGLDEKELLVISKILALKEAKSSNLPKTILKQIKKIEKCIK